MKALLLNTLLDIHGRSLPQSNNYFRTYSMRGWNNMNQQIKINAEISQKSTNRWSIIGSYEFADNNPMKYSIDVDD